MLLLLPVEWLRELQRIRESSEHFQRSLFIANALSRGSRQPITSSHQD